DMNAFMEKNGIASYNDIQKYFERHLSDIVSGTGKVAIAWDDVIGSGMDKDRTIIHWWRADHPESLEKTLENGYRTIISPWDPFYLDYIQDIRCKEGHLAWEQRSNEMDEIYGYKLADDQHVIGIQANLWTERVRTRERLGYMVFPRLIAIAEKAWTSQENLDYDGFLKRLVNEYKYLDSLNVYYYDFRDFDAHPEPKR
ncbi:MAG: family 20 glycosylhydrolase, partial [Bacteroidales bacterium]|nr:family 20 glycosylhydrolase [Bacteroidales bacterium]